ncbi:hypothetical protein KFK09_025033 [Dendrobium nobile]|uniref:Uncharacterized protein n=1 Tax=Dendrobium nobile TaxID=94219 RepID=A0A8T3AEW5_DENNO|nr:hypothetical protein KFK09_025033 [Dendrobium nobile]
MSFLPNLHKSNPEPKPDNTPQLPPPPPRRRRHRRRHRRRRRRRQRLTPMDHLDHRKDQPGPTRAAAAADVVAAAAADVVAAAAADVAAAAAAGAAAADAARCRRPPPPSPAAAAADVAAAAAADVAPPARVPPPPPPMSPPSPSLPPPPPTLDSPWIISIIEKINQARQENASSPWDTLQSIASPNPSVKLIRPLTPLRSSPSAPTTADAAT